MEHINKKQKYDKILNVQKISNSYFQNTHLLHNTLLPYFCNEIPLKLINKLFFRLNYERYNTHIQPHGIVETYYKDTKTSEKRITYKNGVFNGLYEEWYPNGQLEKRWHYKNGILDGLCEHWYRDERLIERINYRNGKPSDFHEVLPSHNGIERYRIL